MAGRDQDTDRHDTGPQDPGDPMLAQTPGVEAQGRGPADGKQPSRRDYHHPAAGWGAARSVASVLWRAREPIDGTRVVFKMNHEDRASTAPAAPGPTTERPAPGHLRERHQARHLGADAQAGRRRSSSRRTPSPSCRRWTRLRARGPGPPDRADALRRRSDKYVPISWDDAFALVGATLRGLDSPNEAAFYTSGRLSNEATFLYQLWARELGHEQPARLLEHVPRGQRPRADRVARHRQGHVRPRRLAAGRLL